MPAPNRLDRKLAAAIAAARPHAESAGIYAQRYTDGAWTVAFAGHADRMTRISDDDDAREMTDAEVAALILDCWESEWDAAGSAP